VPGELVNYLKYIIIWGKIVWEKKCIFWGMALIKRYHENWGTVSKHVIKKAEREKLLHV
jgi:hypothetical protein